jgi:hypothetical protein
MTSQKVSEGITKRTRRVPVQGTVAYKVWRKNVLAGIRRSQMRRRKAGLFTIPETAEKRGLPVAFVKRKADRGEVATVESGARRYIHEAEADRVFGAFGARQGSAA